ncbi:MAG: DUF192 domain-containing protein [Candidatus Micrarchaeota archaeon]|nr:DUF192 domain-containing protein [Candidatus Micrarchaeota archaeon]
MELSNLTKRKSVVADVEIADTEFLRVRGLMFRKKVVPILFIFPSDGIYPIHSHFCPGEFDAVYVSSEGRVVEIFRRIPPGKDLVLPQKKARYLLELPPRLTTQLKIEEGDAISCAQDGRAVL